MQTLSSIWHLPRTPAVYAFYGGDPAEPPAVFVGVAEVLLERVVEQLVIHDFSLPREIPDLPLDPAYLSELRWWEHEDFVDREALRAAEFVASDLLEPILRSRRPIGTRAADLVEDSTFQAKMQSLFGESPTGVVHLPCLERVNHRLQELQEMFFELSRARGT